MKKLLVILGLISLSCEKGDIICDTSFRSYHLYVRDTLKYIEIVDIDRGYTLYLDSGLYTQFKVVDDSYFNIIGPNQRTNFNIRFLYEKDTLPLVQRVQPICVFTDDCHVNMFYPSDTL